MKRTEAPKAAVVEIVPSSPKKKDRPSRIPNLRVIEYSLEGAASETCSHRLELREAILLGYHEVIGRRGLEETHDAWCVLGLRCGGNWRVVEGG